MVAAISMLAFAGVVGAGIQQLLIGGGAQDPTATLPSSIALVGNGTVSGQFGTGVTLGTNGVLLQEALTSGGQSPTPWRLTGVNSAFEVLLSGSGSAMAGTEDPLNTWLSLSSPRHWGYEVGGSIGAPCDPCSFTGTLSIRRTVDHTVLASSSVSMSTDLLP